MCDINGDSRVEVNEIMQFFSEVFKNEINSESVVEKLARIVANTDEEGVAGFIEGCGFKINEAN